MDLEVSGRNKISEHLQQFIGNFIAAYKLLFKVCVGKYYVLFIVSQHSSFFIM
jgi:hypothetical protein